VRWLIAIVVVVLLGAAALLLSRGERSAERADRTPTSTPIAPPAPIARPTVDATRARPAAPPDEEQRFLQMREAVRENRVSDMRDLARDHLRDYPHGVLRAEVESYSGVHPRPSGPDAQ
jgi:hypothetical protein